MEKSNDFNTVLDEFNNILERSGVHDALRFLNRRTPHRFTGIYKYDGATLRNLALFDRSNPGLLKGEDAPMEATYCSLVQKELKFEIKDATTDGRVKGKIITPVISYCGVLIRDAENEPFGTLCHFDMKRCQEPLLDFPLLEEASKALSRHILLGSRNIS